MEIYKKVVKVVHKISYYLSWMAGVILFILMALTFIDVVGRYIFNKPVLGSTEILEQLMVVFIFSVLAQVTVNREHIRAEIITSLFSRRNKAIAGAFGMLIALFGTVVMTLSSAKYIATLQLTTVTGILRIPIAPFFYVATFSLAICCLEMLFDIIRYLLESRGNAGAGNLSKVEETSK